MGNENGRPTREEPGTTAIAEPSCFFAIEDSEQHRVNLKDASPSNLQTLFDLPKPPNILKDKDGTCIFYKADTWTTELSKDSHYKIVLPNSEVKEAAHSPNRIQACGTINALDIHCAIVCTQAAQFCGFGKDESKIEEIEKVFRECDIDKRFDVLCPSIYGDVRYILARSTREGVLYIAFSDDDFNSMMARPATVDTEFLKKDDVYVELIPIKGECNEYIWRQLKNVPVDLILGRCLKSDIKRVVVCGHGVGGALANVFTLCLQLKLNLLRESINNDSSTLPEVVSITFGAPMCLSKDLVEDVGHPDNFFNIVNIEDPVPNVLENAAGVANPPPYVRKTALKKIEVLCQCILEKTTKVFRKENDNQEDAYFDITQKMEELNAFCTEKNISFDDVVKCPFYPIGWYIICCKTKEDLPSDTGARTLFDIHEVNRRATVEHFHNWHVCRVKTVHLIDKLLAKQKIQESAVPLHSINSYFKMVSQSITRNYRASVPREHNELHIAGQSSLHSGVIKNEFSAKAARIRLTKRSKTHWSRMFVEETHLEILLEGENLGFFALSQSNFSRLPIKKGKEPQIKRISAERVELIGEFDAEKCIYKQPSVDVATHFEIIKITTNETNIKNVRATTFADTFVDGLSPMLLLRAWQRGIASVIMKESESREEELIGNNILSQLYKLEKNSLKCRQPRLQAYATKAAGEGFHVLGEPEPELLDILTGIMEDLEDDLVIDFSTTGRILSSFFAKFFLGLSVVSGVFYIRHLQGMALTKCRVVMKRVKKDFIQLGKNFTPKRPSAKPFFGEVAENYSAMLCTYISALRNVQDQTITSEDTMASIYRLEEILHEKYTALGFHGQDVEKILEQNPFKEEHSVASALEDSRRNILRRIQQSCDLFQLRQYLKEECYIGIVGPQDAGKSTLIKELWGLDVGVIGYTAHTNTANVYQVPGVKTLKVADFPGSTSIDEYMAKVIQECGGMASFLILVIPYVGDVSRIHLDEYKNTEGFQLPTLVCINKCAMYLTRSEDFQSERSVDLARKRFADGLQVNAENVFFTEFLDFSEDMRGKGIADLAEVKRWIERKLIELDFYKKGDDELNHALNRPHNCSLE